MEGLSVADALALQNESGKDGMFGGNGILIILLFLLLAGGNGFGGFGGANGTTNMINNDFLYTNLKNTMDTGFNQVYNQNFATQRDILQGFSGVDSAICQLGYQASQNTAQLQASMTNGFRSVDTAVCQLGYQTGMGIRDIQNTIQSCCCSTERSLDQVRFDAERNTCNIVNAIRTDGEATRALINANTMQDLRDRLQKAEFENSQIAQTAQITSAILPKMPVPAYPVPSPYGQYGQFGCGC